MAENALFWRIFVGTTKNAKIKHAIHQQRSSLIYRASRAELRGWILTPTPPRQPLEATTLPQRKIFYFFLKKQGGGKYRKNQTFSFYIFFFL